MDVNAERSQEVTVEQLMAILGASVAQLRVEHLGELVGYGLVFRVDELRDEDPREKAGEVIEFDGECAKLWVGQCPGLKAIEVRVVDGPVPEDKVTHLLIKRHRAPPCPP